MSGWLSRGLITGLQRHLNRCKWQDFFISFVEQIWIHPLSTECPRRKESGVAWSMQTIQHFITEAHLVELHWNQYEYHVTEISVLIYKRQRANINSKFNSEDRGAAVSVNLMAKVQSLCPSVPMLAVRVQVQLDSFLTSGLGQNVLKRWNSPRSQRIGGWVAPRAGLDGLRNG